MIDTISSPFVRDARKAANRQRRWQVIGNVMLTALIGGLVGAVGYGFVISWALLVKALMN